MIMKKLTISYKYVGISIIIIYSVILILFFMPSPSPTDLLILSLICFLFFAAIMVTALFGELKSEYVIYTNSKINEILRWQPIETSVLPKYPDKILVTNKFRELYEATFIKNEKAFKQLCNNKDNEAVQHTKKFPVLYIYNKNNGWVISDKKFTHYRLLQML